MKTMSNGCNEDEYNKKLEKDYKEQLKKRIKRLTKKELQMRIETFLNENCICTLATCADNVPRSTIVRYRSKGLTIYILTEGGGKIKNIRKNPNVSASICGEYSGFDSVTGLQIWGKAEIIKPEEKEKYLEAYRIINLKKRADLRNMDVENIRTRMYIIRICIERARFLSFPEGILNQVLQAQNDKR